MFLLWDGLLSSYLVFFVSEQPSITPADFLRDKTILSKLPVTPVFFRPSSPLRRRLMTCLTSLLSIAILGIYSYIYYYNTDSGVGLMNSIFVEVIDVLTCILASINPLLPPFVSVVLLLLSRTSLLLFGQPYWFLGHSVAFVVFAVFYSVLSVIKLVPAATPKERKQIQILFQRLENAELEKEKQKNTTNSDDAISHLHSRWHLSLNMNPM